MKRRFAILMIGFLLAAANVFAADGDLIVNGNMGIGTTTPGAKLEVNTWAGTAPAGFNPILNIVGGYAGNNTQGHSIDFHINLLGSYPASRIISTMSNGTGGELQFHTTPHYVNTAATARMTINSSGFVGIGTTSPSSHLQIESADAGTQLRMTNTSSGGRTWNFYSQGGSGNLHVWEDGAPTTRLLIQGGTGYVGIGTPSPSYTLHVNGSAYSSGGWSGSDIRWKKNINPIENALESVLKLQGVNYEWRVDEYKDKNFEEGRQIGLIAQEVEQVIPELVNTDNEGYKAVSYEKLTAVLVEAIKEQQKRIKELEDKINTLEKDRK